MRSFDLPILGGLSRIDEVVDDSVRCTELIERMKCFHRHVGAFGGTEIPVGERRVVVGLDPGGLMREPINDVNKKCHRMKTRLLLEDAQVSPPRGAVDGRVLEIRLSCNESWHMLHIDLDQTLRA